MDSSRQVTKVLWQVLFLNIAVAISKITLGVISNSASVTADGFHSLSDGSSNVVGLFGMRFAGKPIDEDHPYGHKKFETLAAMVIGGMLLIVSVGVLRSAWGRFQNPVVPDASPLSFVVMAATMGVNLAVFRYEKHWGKQLKSDILISDSNHTFSDLYVSASVLIGLIGVRLGYPIVDPVVSVVIAILIGRAAIEIWAGCLATLTDRSKLDAKQVEELVLSVEGVASCHKIRSRGRDDDLKLDLHIQVAPNMTVAESHQVVHTVAVRIKAEVPTVSDVVIHTEPRDEPDVSRGRS